MTDKQSKVKFELALRARELDDKRLKKVIDEMSEEFEVHKLKNPNKWLANVEIEVKAQGFQTEAIKEEISIGNMNY